MAGGERPASVRGLASYGDLALVASLALASAVLLDCGVVCSNDGANYALIRAFGDGTTQIDPYREYTYDLDYSMREGHYYSPRAPGTAFLALPFFAIAHRFTDHDPTLQFFCGIPPAIFLAALACLTYLVVLQLGYSRGAGVFTALALCLATPLRSYASGAWSHTIAAFFSLALVGLAHRVLTRDESAARWQRNAIGLGLLAACVVSLDYSGTVYATIALVIVVVERARRTSVREAALRWALPITIGGLVGMAPTLLYHQIAFASPFATGYRYVVGRYVAVNRLSGMYGGSFIDGFLGLLFHARGGLFLWSPIFLACLLVLRGYLSRLGGRAAMLLMTLPAIAMLVLTSFYTWWDGGGVHDVRFITQSLPLFALPIAAAADASITGPGPRRPLAALGFSVLFALSLLLQAVKHHAYWARDGSMWIPRLESAGDDLGRVLGAFAAWCWPHPIAAAVIVAIGVGIAIASAVRERAAVP